MAERQWEARFQRVLGYHIRIEPSSRVVDDDRDPVGATREGPEDAPSDAMVQPQSMDRRGPPRILQICAQPGHSRRTDAGVCPARQNAGVSADPMAEVKAGSERLRDTDRNPARRKRKHAFAASTPQAPARSLLVVAERDVGAPPVIELLVDADGRRQSAKRRESGVGRVRLARDKAVAQWGTE